MLKDNIKYCFLDCLFVDVNDKIDLCRIVSTDELFQVVYRQSLYLEQVEQLCKEINDKNIVSDFKLVNGCLNCDPAVPSRRMPLKVSTDEKMYTLQGDSDIYSFFKLGMENNFHIIADSIENDYVGTEFTHFRDIRFADNTMSVYAPIVKESNELYNKMLITCQHGILSIHKFKFIVPVEYMGNMTWDVLRKIKVNNSEYFLCEQNSLGLYSEEYVVSSPVLTKALVMRDKYKNAVQLLEDFLNLIIDKPAKSMTWCGGSGSHADGLGVYFSNAQKNLTKADRINLINIFCDEVVNKIDNRTEANKLMQQACYNELSAFSVLYLVQCYFYSKEHDVPIYNVLLQVIKQLNTYRVTIELQLYSVRANAFVRRRPLVPAISPILYGSDENTTVMSESRFL